MLKTLSPRLASWPLLLCSFRPMFLATVLLAVAGIALWLGFLGFGLLLPGVHGK